MVDSIEIRWLHRVDGTEVLQYRERYQDIDDYFAVSKWTDVPIEKENETI